MTKFVAKEVSSPRLQDMYRSLVEFESTLQDALAAARTAFEISFCSQVAENYRDFRGRMYWSEGKDQRLRSIAGPDD